MRKENWKYNIAEIKMDRLSEDKAFELTKKLAELGYDTITEYCLVAEAYEVFGRKRYVVNNDPAETRLFNKVVDTFKEAVTLLAKGGGVMIEVDYSLGMIDISVSPKK